MVRLPAETFGELPALLGPSPRRRDAARADLEQRRVVVTLAGRVGAALARADTPRLP